MDIEQILRERGVEYIESGPNVRKGWIGIKCPWCGDADPSQHLGIEPTTGRWACWRNAQHRGRTPHGLLMKLLGCSWEAAQALLTDASDLRSVVDRLRPRPPEEIMREEKLGPEYGLTKLTTSPMHHRFCDYLSGRGFGYEHVPMMADLYGLQCALVGRFKARVVFPVKDVRGGTVGYTGRCVDGGKLRYLSHPGRVVKQNILWHDLLLMRGGRRLYITEGPFDALKLDYVFRMSGSPDRATCLFGISYTTAQLMQLFDLIPLFDEIKVLFDRRALAEGMMLRQNLVKAGVETLPDGVDDPGGLSWGQVILMGAQQKRAG